MTDGPVHGTWEPGPAARWEDGFLSGNGHHGALLFGGPDDERIVVTHHTLVRPNGAEHARPPRLAAELPALQDRLLGGELDAAERFTDGRPLQWVQPFHPAFQIRLRRPRAATAGYRRSVDFTTGVLHTECRTGRSQVFVSRADDVIVQHVEATDLVVSLDHRLPGVPDTLLVGQSIVPAADGALLTLRVRHADSDRRYTGITLVVHTGGRTALTPQGAQVTGAESVLLLTRVIRHTGELDTTPHVEALRDMAAESEWVPESGSEPRPGTRSETESETDSEVGSETGSGTKRGSGFETDSEVGSETGSGTKPGSGSETDSEVGSETGSGTKPGSGFETDSGTRSESRPVTDSGTRPESRPVTFSETDSGTRSESRPASGAYARLLDRHIPLHRTAYERVTLALGADPAERALPGSELLARPDSPALLERLFAAGRYHLLSSSGLFPPRLTGLWTGDWDTAWAGAFTNDANLSLQTASAACAALPEVTEALASLIHRQLPDWQDNAREIFGTRGVVAPPHSDGESGLTYHFSREYPLHLWTAGADWLLKPLVDHDETRGEQDPRTARALAEVAQFYEDFLQRADANGHLVIVPSYSPENRPANASWGAINAAMDLSAARHALLTAAAYHPGKAEAWRALADRLPPHRINADGALAEWAWSGLDDTYDHRHLSHLYGVWPLDEITPYDTPDLARAAHRALELRGSENDSAHGHLHHALVAARLRDGERVAHALGQVLKGDFFHTSLMSAHYPNRDVYNADAAHTLPAVVVEMLVQSTPDRLVLLPALPATCPRGELRGIRTRFGAELDLTWNPTQAIAVLRPTRTHRVELRTSSGAESLDLVAGEDHVLRREAW